VHTNAKENPKSLSSQFSDGVACPLSQVPPGIGALSEDLCITLGQAGCPLSSALQKRLEFEALLAELSSKFVNLAAHEVDSQIQWGLRRIVEVLGIDRSGLGEVSLDKTQLVVTHSYERPEIPSSKNFMIDCHFPVYSKMIYQGVVIRLPDDLPADAIRERDYCIQSGLKSNVTIPLVVMGSVVGGIGFSSFRSNRILPDELIPRLRLVGDIFTNALARKRADEALSAKEQSLQQAKDSLKHLATKLIHSQEEERSRVAREMHDDWTQRLALLGIDVARLEGQLDSKASALPLVQAIRETVARLAEDVHALSRQLHPSIIDDLGLAEALRSECCSFSRREGIDVDYCCVDVPVKLPKDVALCIYRVAQEGLRNVAKHAAVNCTSVTLNVDQGDLQLRIIDHGIGFDSTSLRAQPGLGLSSMEERVSLAHGKLSIVSALGQGTTVEMRVPLESFQQ
jgi:signal transduction histidine kinase